MKRQHFDNTYYFSLLILNWHFQIKLGSQYYFYMETQTALAIPDEDNCVVVYSSSQCPEYAHRVIAQCLGVPDHNVRVLTRRVGGGFGGKAIRAMPVSMISISNHFVPTTTRAKCGLICKCIFHLCFISEYIIL